MNADIVNLQNQSALGEVNKPPREDPTQLGKDDFLRLLVTQMAAQDPLNPQDSDQFIAQLTDFSMLEEMINNGKSLDDIVSVTAAGNQANAVSLLGKEVRVAGNSIRGPEAKVFYKLPEEADSIQIEVRDKDNNIVKVIDDVPASEGLHEFNIDGLDEGKDYSFIVNAKNADKEEIAINYSVSERVSGVNFSQAVPVLLMKSGREISTSEVVEIRQPDQEAQEGADG